MPSNSVIGRQILKLLNTGTLFFFSRVDAALATSRQDISPFVIGYRRTLLASRAGIPEVIRIANARNKPLVEMLAERTSQCDGQAFRLSFYARMSASQRGPVRYQVLTDFVGLTVTEELPESANTSRGRFSIYLGRVLPNDKAIRGSVAIRKGPDFRRR